MSGRPIHLTADELRDIIPNQGDRPVGRSAKRAKRPIGSGFDGTRRRDLAVKTLGNLEGLTKQQVRSVLETALAMLDC